MLKKILTLSLLFMLFSCGSDSSSWLVNKRLADFSIWVPANWEIIDNSDGALPNPSSWKIELSAVSKEAKYGFKNNLIILSDKLNSFTTSSDFIIANSVWFKDSYLDYTLFDSKEITFSNEEKSLLYVFEARYNSSTPKLKFLQTAIVCNRTKAFLLTVSISPKNRDVSKYESLLSTFKCEDILKK
jgi:hypothetical protein